MARFSAFTSDASESDDDDRSERHHSNVGKDRRSDPEPVEEEDSEDSSSSSDMYEEELLHSPSRKKPTRTTFVEDEDEDEDIDEREGLNRSGETDVRVASTSSSPSPPMPRIDPTIIPWAQQVGIDAQKMHVMQASLFRMPEEAAALNAMNESTRRQPPKVLWPLNKRHRRDSGGDGLRSDLRERPSFAHNISPLPLRPSQKYARIETSASTVNGSEGAIVDAGLTLGRSFRVGWGPRGLLVHLGEICGPLSTPCTSANSSIVTITTVPTISSPDFGEVASMLLQHHLSNSPIGPDEDGIPFANPSSDLRFSSFVSLFSPTDRSYKASLFRLGHALFDDMDLRLGDSISIDIRNQIASIRRKATLSAWLEEAVIPAVESELKENTATTTGSAAAAYKLLTGNQVEKACERAMDEKNMKLATLIAQGGGDSEFKEDLRDQLRIWREDRIDVHIDESIRKVYALLAGIVDVVEGSKGTGLERCSDIDLLKGLDWKRTFGFHLWFSEPLEATIGQVFQSYNRLWKESPSRVTPPLPSYIESPTPTPPLPLHSATPPPDALFSLIRLYAEPACSLSRILMPLSFGPAPLDYSLPWHLYILLSRCIRVRDFSDRSDPGVDLDIIESQGGGAPRVEGHSPSADLLASSFAFQLEGLGMIQEALFVLLHIEGSVGREKAVKELLFRSAPQLDEWMTRGVVGSLKIPASWVNEAKAIHALDKGEVWEAYKLYIAAGLYNAAHDLAVLELAPEAVIRQDFDLVKTIFSKLGHHGVDGWHNRGKAFLDYVEIMTGLPELRERLREEEETAAHEIEFEELIRRIPRLVGILPEALRDRSDARHNVALAKMISGLVALLDEVQPHALSPSQVQPALVDQATKIRHIHSTARERFLRTVEVA